MNAEIELLELAFPAEHGAVDGSCAWCGRKRVRSHALCRDCWRGLTPRQRADYLGLDLLDRARWIIAGAPPEAEA
jgi:ribosomal protein S14